MNFNLSDIDLFKGEMVDQSTQVYAQETLKMKLRTRKLSNVTLTKQSERNLMSALGKEKRNLMSNLDFRTKTYRNVITSANFDLANSTEKRIFDFLNQMVNDYEILGYSAIEKCSRKDLNGKIKVYTNKCIRFISEDEFIQKKDASTQTKSIPNYMMPLNRNQLV